MGANKNVNSPQQWLVICEVIQILLDIVYSVISLVLGIGLAASFSRRFLISDCLVESNMHTPPVDLSLISFISTFIATFMVMGILYYELTKSDLFIKIYVGIYGSFIGFVFLMILAINR